MAIPDIAVSTQLKYVKEMSGMFLRLGIDRLELLNSMTALKMMGGEVPEHQAIPLTRQHVAQLLRFWSGEGDGLRLAIMIAWKTASRWGEVSMLTKRNFVSVQANEVIICWGTIPKGWRGKPFHHSMYTVIEGTWTRDIATVAASVSADAPFCPWDTQTLDTKFKDLPPVLNTYTAHSFKRGAACHLIALRAQKIADFDERHFSILLKHKQVCDLMYAQSSLRYMDQGANMARELGTGNVTRLL
jgi:hypothetical protein